MLIAFNISLLLYNKNPRKNFPGIVMIKNNVLFFDKLNFGYITIVIYYNNIYSFL